MDVEEKNRGRLETWTAEEVRRAFEAGEILLVDVRTPQEYLGERIPGALNYPMQDFDPATLPGQALDHVVFHCGSGKRSEKVSESALKKGAARVAHLEGGFKAWKDAGFPYVTTDPATGAPKKVNT